MKISRIITSFFILVVFNSAAIAADQSKLFAHKWYLGILNQEALIMADFTVQKPYLEFFENNTFIAFIGCNKINGNFMLSEPNGLKLYANNPTSYSIDCDKKFLELEGNFINSLPNVNVWEITNEVLYLKNSAKDIISVAIFMPHEPY